MFKEILKIIPQLDNAKLNEMEKRLSKRFGGVAKKFGKGLLGSVVGGGLLGMAAGLIDKLLNPLKEVNESIDRTVGSIGSIMDNAPMFNTTEGKLFKLSKVAQASGLDQEGLFALLTKYQTAVLAAKNDPSAPSTVRQFAGDTDMAESFYSFIQSVQKTKNPDDRANMIRDVFGEKMGRKSAGLLAADLPQRMNDIGAMSSKQYDAALQAIDYFGDKLDEGKAKRELQDVVNKALLINESVVKMRNERASQELQLENDRLGGYVGLAKIEIASQKVIQLLEGYYRDFASIATDTKSMKAMIEKISISGILKGIITGGKKE